MEDGWMLEFGCFVEDGMNQLTDDVLIKQSASTYIN